MTDDTATPPAEAINVDASIWPRLLSAGARMAVAAAAGWLLKGGYVNQDMVEKYSPLAIAGVLAGWQYLASKSTHDKLKAMASELPNEFAKITTWLK